MPVSIKGEISFVDSFMSHQESPVFNRFTTLKYVRKGTGEMVSHHGLNELLVMLMFIKRGRKSDHVILSVK